jgi:muconolactone delta-isomerase
MLHMIVMTHGPDTCAAANAASGNMARNAMDKMDEASKKHQVTIQGKWVDPPGHVFYILADAPNAHAINNLMTELQFFLWNTVDIHPIVTLEEAMPLAKPA